MKFQIAFGFTLLVLMISGRLSATTYYISNNGNDSNDGISVNTPLQTLGALSSIVYVPGDSILFESGNTFYGTLVVSMNGSVTKRLYIGIYNGNIPAVITGGLSVTNWNISGGLASAVYTQPVYALFLQSQRQTPARFPNNGYLTIASAAGTNGLSCDALNQPSGYWNGATVRIRTIPNQFETAIVQQYDNGTIQFLNPVTYTPAAGNGFYIDNSFNALDVAGEWFYDVTNALLWYKPYVASDLSSGNLIAVTQDYGIQFTSNCDSITIENLRFTYQNKSAIYFPGVVSKSSILHCGMYYGNDAAVKTGGMASGLFFSNNTISEYLMNGLHCYQLWYSDIIDNTFENIGIWPGQGSNGYFQYTPVFSFFTAYNNISDNVFSRFGKSALKTDGPYNSYKRNLIKDGMWSVSASGAIDLYGEISGENTIEDNFIFNIIGNQEGLSQKDPLVCGILLNMYCHDNTIRHNTIANAGNYGIWIAAHNTKHYIQQNLIYNSQRAQLSLNDFYGTPGSNKEHQITHNTFYSLHPRQAGMEYETLNASNQFSTSDSNYYCNPYHYAAVREHYYADDDVTLYYPLPQWQKKYGLDTSSFAMRHTLNAFEILSEVGFELISNGNFTNNFDNWELLSEQGVALLLDNETAMDGGCIKILIQDTGVSFAQIHSKNFSVQSSAFYRLRYSVLGDKNSYMESSVYFNGEDYRSVGLGRYVTYDTTRTERELIFKPTEDCNDCAVRFSFYQGDSLLMMDNISLRQVIVNPLDSTRSNRLFYNYSNQPLTLSLNDTVYMDIHGNIISGSITLEPFQSVVLIPKQVIYTYVHPIIEDERFLINTYPNPAQEYIQVSLQNENISAFLELYHINGMLLQQHFFGASEKKNISLDGLPAGVYVIRVLAGNNAKAVKFVKW